MSPLTITFAPADPDTVPIVASAPVQLTYRVRQNNNQPWTLTVLADGDLISGSVNGRYLQCQLGRDAGAAVSERHLSKTVAQRLASGVGNLANPSQGQITFRLANSWNYSAGLYTQTIVFTLSAP